MKFNDIKEGDTVHITKDVVKNLYRFTVRKCSWYYVPVKVVKVTPARFTTEEGITYSKKDGYSYPRGSGMTYSAEEVQELKYGYGSHESYIRDSKKRELLTEINDKLGILKGCIQNGSIFDLELNTLKNVNNQVDFVLSDVEEKNS